MEQGRKSNMLTNEELSVLSWQFAELCAAGVAWSDSAAMLLEEDTSPRIKAALKVIAEETAMGEPLEHALAKTGQFPAYFLHMTEIGQLSGRLDEVFHALSLYYKRETALAEAINRAVTYPAVMASLLSLIFLVLVIQVLPVFSQVFAQLGTGASPVLMALVGAGSAGKYIAIGLSCLLLIGAILLFVLFRGERGAKLFTRGKVAAALGRSRFASAMAMMLQSGLNIDEAMERVQEMLADSPLAAQVEGCRRKMAAGVSFPRAMTDTGLFTGMQAGMLAAGFRTGSMEGSMNEIAGRCQEQSEQMMERLLSATEYILLIVLCTVVGALLLSVMLPLLGVLSSIGG